MKTIISILLLALCGSANATVINFNTFNVGDGLDEVNAITSPLGATISVSTPRPFQIVSAGGINVAESRTNAQQGDFLINFADPVDFVRIAFTDNAVVSLATFNAPQTVDSVQLVDPDKFILTQAPITLELFDSGIRAARLEANFPRVRVSSIEFGQLNTVPLPATLLLFLTGLMPIYKNKASLFRKANNPMVSVASI